MVTLKLMTKQEQKILYALQGRFYKVGRFIMGRIFDPYVYIKNGEAVEAYNLTLDEAKALIRKTKRTLPEYYHIFNNKNKWVSHLK